MSLKVGSVVLRSQARLMPLICEARVRSLFSSATFREADGNLTKDKGNLMKDNFDHFGDRFFFYLGWAALGTAMAVGFGIVLGLLIELTSWLLAGASGTMRIDVAMGGALFGLVGGPIFGIAFGFLRSVARANGKGRSWRVRTYAATGAMILMAVPWVVGLLRHRAIIPRQDEIPDILGGMTFLGVSGAIFGSLVGLAFGKSTSNPSHKAGESLDE